MKPYSPDETVAEYIDRLEAEITRLERASVAAAPCFDNTEPSPDESKLIEILHKHAGTNNGMRIWSDMEAAGLTVVSRPLHGGTEKTSEGQS
jgi:hypothetical protein